MTSYKNFLFYGGIVLALGGGLFLLSRNSNSSTLPALTALATEHVSYNFGQVSMAKGTVSHKYQIKNSSDQTVTIEKIYTSCICTKAVLHIDGIQAGPYGMAGHSVLPKVNQTLAPGQIAELEAIFDPAAHGPAGLGKLSRVVVLETADQRQMELKFDVEVIP